jgi:hypothetical protein
MLFAGRAYRSGTNSFTKAESGWILGMKFFLFHVSES